MKNIKPWILLFSVFIAVTASSQIQNAFPGKKTRILFLLDASGSMVAEMGKTNRWAVSVTLISRMVDSLRLVENCEVGLRVFGHGKPITMRDCYDTKLEVPFAPNNHKGFITKLRQVKPLGFTSITQSLLATAKDFPVDKNSRNVIILITDGIEECPGDPCAVSQELQRKGIILQPFIIGLGTDGEKFKQTYSCAGRYFNAQTEDEFKKIIGVIVSQTLNNTSVQFNLLDNQNQPRESDIPITVYDAISGQVLENVVHTMNGKGIPDTLYLDPMRKYDIVVHTLPNVTRRNVELQPGRHNILPFETPMGSLALKVGGITKYGRLQAIVRQTGSMETLFAQDFQTTKKYLTGKYDLELLTLPRMFIPAVELLQNKTYTVEIPAPGQLQLTLGRDVVASIFVYRENKMEWVTDIDGTRTSQLITMQPGDYKAVYRAKSETRTLYSKTIDFKITTGSNTVLTL
ncbi:MAG: vWA domain-containing protein [Sphingomonadales bacterium]|jgi:Ca-activated chloride channel family protein